MAESKRFFQPIFKHHRTVAALSTSVSTVCSSSCLSSFDRPHRLPAATATFPHPSTAHNRTLFSFSFSFVHLLLSSLLNLKHSADVVPSPVHLVTSTCFSFSPIFQLLFLVCPSSSFRRSSTSRAQQTPFHHPLN